jgi:hypothetical protein
MASLLFNVELWREYARQSRSLRALIDPRSRQRLLAVEAGFDWIAEGDVYLWRECAKKTRSISKGINNPETKQHMLAIAAGLERVGDLASRLQSRSVPRTHTPRPQRRLRGWRHLIRW